MVLCKICMYVYSNQYGGPESYYIRLEEAHVGRLELLAPQFQRKKNKLEMILKIKRTRELDWMQKWKSMLRYVKL